MYKNIIYLILGFCVAIPAGVKVQGHPEYLIGDNQQPFQKPIWSGDGRFLAFSGDQYSGIYVLQLSDRHLSQLSDEPAAGYGMVWSSDSKAIASRVSKQDGLYRYNALKIFNVEALSSQMLCSFQTAPLGMPLFSSDDSRLYCVNRKVLQSYATGKPVTSLSKISLRSLPYTLNERLMVLSPTGEATVLLQDRRILNLTTSRDGQFIAFEIMGGPMCIIKTDGSGFRELGVGHRPCFSPDGRHLVYMVTQDDGHDYLSADLYVMAVDGSERQSLTRSSDKLEMNPCWSPDGRQIAFDVINEGAVYILNVTSE
jgi:Tol biopolymer transport system component